MLYLLRKSRVTLYGQQCYGGCGSVVSVKAAKHEQKSKGPLTTTTSQQLLLL